MDDLWQADKLALFVAFFIPGFIASEVYSLFIATGERDFAKQVPAIVAYSAMHYAFFGWIIFAAPQGPVRGVSAYAVVLVLPLLWPPLILLIRDRETWFDRIFSKRLFSFLVQPEATPWDRVFSNATESWVRVKLKSGGYIGGALGAGSRASAFPSAEQLYVSERWDIAEDGTFIAAKAGAGFLVNGTEIEFIELVDYRELGDTAL